MKTLCFYQGPSWLDGRPVLGIATGLLSKKGMASENAKTGDMVQVWLILEHIPPHIATKTGADTSVCGACPFRPLLAKAARLKGRYAPTCYVRDSKSFAALVNIYRSWQMGNIPLLSPEEAAPRLAGRVVRLGAWGDPAAVPMAVWDPLLTQAQAVLGYTHQWARCEVGLSRYCMASVESLVQREWAHARGFRTFRVDNLHLGLRAQGEVRCPASEEAGHMMTCKKCLHCSGTATGRRSDVVIDAH